MYSYSVCCDNCRRKGPDLKVRRFPRTGLKGKHSKTYYAIPKLTKEQKRSCRRNCENDTHVMLCSCCERYLLEGSTDANDYWPSMVYEFLVHTNSKDSLKVRFWQKWRLIPATWRPWWQDSLLYLRQSIENMPLFVDLTGELQEVKETIEELRWVRLAKCMDTHFVYPEVSAMHL